MKREWVDENGDENGYRLGVAILGTGVVTLAAAVPLLRKERSRRS
jgi:hypothetical protein